MTAVRFPAITLLILMTGVSGVCQNAPGSVSPLRESVITGAPSSEPISLTLLDAITRALRNNLAILTAGHRERVAAAERLSSLSELLPRVNGRLDTIQQQTNLAAFGFPGFPGVPQILGPFGLIDARASLSQPILDLTRLHELREASENQQAVVLGNQNTRELVVLTVMDLYFQAVSGESRAKAVEAQVTRAQVLLDRATDLKSSGLIPGIDVVRAQVELQTQRQRLIQARNEFAREKLNLARAIGLPLAQDYALANELPSGASPSMPLQEMMDRAYQNRADAKAAAAQVRAAEEAAKAARAENFPTLNVDADYGVIGRAPGNSHGTFSITGSLRFPIFNSDARSDTMEKQALLDERRVELDSLNGRIEHEIRSALLEVQSAEEQLKVAQSSLDLVRQQLDQAQDRFVAGVANNLEVVQAQEALALADENVISSLYGFNVARAVLARSMGVAEQSMQEFFGGNTRQ